MWVLEWPTIASFNWQDGKGVLWSNACIPTALAINATRFPSFWIEMHRSAQE